MNKVEPYTVTVYVALPDTRLPDSKDPNVFHGTSGMGHMYLEVAHGNHRESMGWQPTDPLPGGGYRGEPVDTDVRTYKEPYYARTLEITQEQFGKLREYGAAPLRYGMDPKYDPMTNSCTDFAWGALNHAGLHARALGVEFESFEGKSHPRDNIPHVRSIEPPFPNSPLNKEVRNPAPRQTFQQWLFTDNDSVMGNQIAQGVAALDASHGRTPDEASERMCGSLFCLVKENGLSRVDHVLLSKADAQGQSGTNVFVVQGEPSDPAHLRASISTAVAAQTPLQESMERAERIVQSQTSAQVATQQQTQVQDQEQQAVNQRMA